MANDSCVSEEENGQASKSIDGSLYPKSMETLLKTFEAKLISIGMVGV